MHTHTHTLTHSKISLRSPENLMMFRIEEITKEEWGGMKKKIKSEKN